MWKMWYTWKFPQRSEFSAGCREGLEMFCQDQWTELKTNKRKQRSCSMWSCFTIFILAVVIALAVLITNIQASFSTVSLDTLCLNSCVLSFWSCWVEGKQQRYSFSEYNPRTTRENHRRTRQCRLRWWNQVWWRNHFSANFFNWPSLR